MTLIPFLGKLYYTIDVYDSLAIDAIEDGWWKVMDDIGFFKSHRAYKRKECYAAVKTFKEFFNNSCRYGDVSVVFMTAYREYLLKSTIADGSRRHSNNTASGYLKNIKRLLRIAYIEHMIDTDTT